MLYEKFPTEDDKILAGEHALGLLSEIEAAKFERRLEAEPILQGIYNAWLLEFPPLEEEHRPDVANVKADQKRSAPQPSASTGPAPSTPPSRVTAVWSRLRTTGQWMTAPKLATAAAGEIDSGSAFYKQRRAIRRRETLVEVLRQVVIGVEIAAVLAICVTVGVLALIGPSQPMPLTGAVIIGP